MWRDRWHNRTVALERRLCCFFWWSDSWTYSWFLFFFFSQCLAQWMGFLAGSVFFGFESFFPLVVCCVIPKFLHLLVLCHSKKNPWCNYCIWNNSNIIITFAGQIVLVVARVFSNGYYTFWIDLGAISSETFWSGLGSISTEDRFSLFTLTTW